MKKKIEERNIKKEEKYHWLFEVKRNELNVSCYKEILKLFIELMMNKLSTNINNIFESWF